MENCCCTVKIRDSEEGPIRGVLIAREHEDGGRVIVIRRRPSTAAAMSSTAESSSSSSSSFYATAIATSSVASVEPAPAGAEWAAVLCAALAAGAADVSPARAVIALSHLDLAARLAEVVALLAARRIPAAQRDDGVVEVMGGMLTIAPPYDEASCLSANEIVLQRIRAVIAPLRVAPPLAPALHVPAAPTAAPARCEQCGLAGTASELASNAHYDFGTFYCTRCWGTLDAKQQLDAGDAVVAACTR